MPASVEPINGRIPGTWQAQPMKPSRSQPSGASRDWKNGVSRWLAWR
jgi:hypothetical protein